MIADAVNTGSVQSWALRLYDSGLIPLPCWGGGKALPGTHYKELADNLLSRERVAKADYSGGLSILLGNRRYSGGFITGLDVDEGPTQWTHGFDSTLLIEEGTSPGKWHVFMVSADRLTGQLNLRDQSGKLVAEIKGYGLALRSWPTQPEDKPRGYRVAAFPGGRLQSSPQITVSEISRVLVSFLTQDIGREVQIEVSRRAQFHGQHSFWMRPGLAREIESELDRRKGQAVGGG